MVNLSICSLSATVVYNYVRVVLYSTVYSANNELGCQGVNELRCPSNVGFSMHLGGMMPIHHTRNQPKYWLKFRKILKTIQRSHS